jgi:hypothetical protein
MAVSLMGPKPSTAGVVRDHAGGRSERTQRLVIFQHLSNGLLGALDCDGHVPVSDGLVTDDGHERREHE